MKMPLLTGLFFDPDTNSDGVLDPMEVEALFQKEVRASGFRVVWAIRISSLDKMVFMVLDKMVLDKMVFH